MHNRLIVYFFLATTAFRADGQNWKWGDINFDQEVNIADITSLASTLATTANTGNEWLRSDINTDGEVSIADLTRLIQIITHDEATGDKCASHTLPIIYINTQLGQNIVSKNDYINATYYIDPTNTSNDSIGSIDNQLPLEIRGRGNSTWLYPLKKPYRLKLKQKEALTGTYKNKHFTLLAHAEDWLAFLRNEVGFEVSKRMGMSYTPATRPVELVLNGDYKGIYFLTDQIRVDKNRVNVVEQDDFETDPDRITGGWLIELDNYPDSYQVKIPEGSGESLWITPHSPEQLSPEQANYLTHLFATADSLIYIPDKSISDWEKYIDVDSLACFYITQEILDNCEAFSGSCFMHKQRGDSTKLIFGPVWDFGSAFPRHKQPQTKFIYEDIPAYCRTRWIAEIAKFPHFNEVISRHWKEFYSNKFQSLHQFIDDYVQYIQYAAECDYRRWPQYSGNNITGRKRTFVKLLDEKVKFLNEKWSLQ